MKNKLLSLIIAAFLAAGLFSPQVSGYLGASVSAVRAAGVSAPSASHDSGTYTVSQRLTVKLSADKGATIYYSTGGTYKAYTKTLSLKKNTTLKCYSVKNGVQSKTVTYKYKLVPKVTFSVDAGAYDTAQTVKLSSTASSVRFYYTLDGSKPGTSSALYTTSGIAVSESAKLRVLAKKSGWSGKYYTSSYLIVSDVVSAPDGGDITADYSGKYLYNQLNSTEKQVYARIYAAAEAHSGEIDVSDLSVNGDMLYRAYWAFDYDNAQFYWLANGYSYTYTEDNGKVYSLKLIYSRTESQSRALRGSFDAAAEKIIADAEKQTDAFLRLKSIHDAVVNMTDYTHNNTLYISEADGVLVYGKALCEGYSKAFMYLAQKMGYECICATGYVEGVGHMWNMVKVDGAWYHVDVTFDDPIGGAPVCTEEYFCVSTSTIRQNRTIDVTFTLPQATRDYAK